MARDLQAPDQTMTRTPRRPSLALLLAMGAMALPPVAVAQPVAPGVPAAALPQAPAMVQAPTAPVPPVAPVAAPSPMAAAPTPTSSGSGATFQSKVGREKAAKIETRIARLHKALRITPAQEPLWQNFAAVMRQNVVELDGVYAKRESQYGAMNAVQDLQSYAAVQEANARNVQMLLPPFQALYDSLSPEQKTAADATFEHTTSKALQKSG